MDKVYLTPDGFKKLEEELRNLRLVERPAVVNAISEARALGDLSENAEYQYAKDKQGFIEGRIKELESKLSRAEIIDITKLTGNTVKFGATVTVCDQASSCESTYRIVGVDEADIKHSLLSIDSPLAKALIGKKIDDEVRIETPAGKKIYEIVNISYI